MRKFTGAIVLALATVASAFPAPPEVPVDITAKEGRTKEIIVKAPKGKKIGFRMTGGTSADLFRELTAGQDVTDHVFWLSVDDTGRRSIVWWLEGEIESSETVINRGVQPKPDDGKKPDDKKPDPIVPPKPVTSFLVFIVHDNQFVTLGQKTVIDGSAVENYLTATCTGGKNGWRRRDKDIPGDPDPTMKAFWEKAQPEFTVKGTKTPAFAISVNGDISIEPIPENATSASMIALLKTYNGGK